MTDSEFDDEFRKKLEDLHHEFDPDSWSVLEENLNLRAVRRRRMIRTGIALFTGLLLLFISGALYINSTQKGQKNTDGNSASDKTDKAAAGKGDGQTDGVKTSETLTGTNQGNSENTNNAGSAGASGNTLGAGNTAASGNAVSSGSTGKSGSTVTADNTGTSANSVNSGNTTASGNATKSDRSDMTGHPELYSSNNKLAAGSTAGKIATGSSATASGSRTTSTKHLLHSPTHLETVQKEDAAGSLRADRESTSVKGKENALEKASKHKRYTDLASGQTSSAESPQSAAAENTSTQNSSIENTSARNHYSSRPARSNSSQGYDEISSQGNLNELSGLRAIKPVLVYKQGSPLALQISPVQGSNASALSKAKQKKEKIVKQSYPKNWLLSLSAAPENNSVSFNPVKGQLGLSLGATLGYNFSPRWTVWAGAAYSIKLYNNSWKFTDSASNVQNGNVDANCKVLEIPVYMHYNIYNGERSNVYLGAGISTYFLLKEDYKFYATASPGTVLYSQTVKGKNKNLLNVVQVMAGYQLKFSNSVAIGVQPFIKIPLTGVGQHKYTDISTGASLILNFKLNNRN